MYRFFLILIIIMLYKSDSLIKKNNNIDKKIMKPNDLHRKTIEKVFLFSNLDFVNAYD